MESNRGDERSYDAIIVGAGPGGSSTALFLAKAGKKTLLIDKARFPREKVCGDAFSGKSIGIARELGLIDEFGQHPHAIVHGLTMVAPNGKAVTVPFPNATGMILRATPYSACARTTSSFQPRFSTPTYSYGRTST